MNDKVKKNKTGTPSETVFTIENYRSIKKVSLTLSDITVLIGRNNSGKSNIMQAIYKASEGKTLNYEDFNNTPDKENEIPICRVTVQYDGKKYCCTTNKKYKFEWDKKLPFEIMYLPAIPIQKDVNSAETTRTFGRIYKLLSSKKELEINDTIIKAQKKIAKFDEETTSTISTFLSDELSEQEFDIKSVSYEPSEVSSDVFLKFRKLLVKETSNDKTFEWTNMGHGTQRVIMMHLFSKLGELKDNDKNFVFLFIEEPEIFMHPQQQRAFANTLFSGDYSKKCKLVVSTHSPYFIDEDDLSGLRRVYRNFVSGVKETNIYNDGKPLPQYNLKKGKVANISATGQDPNPLTLKYIKIMKAFHLEPHIKDVFFAKKVIVVEGDAEKLILPFLLKTDATVLNTRGNKQICNFVHILKDFGIKFIVAIDDDYARDNIENLDLGDEKKKSRESTMKVINDLAELGVLEENRNLCLIEGDFCSSIGIKGDGKIEKITEILYTNSVSKLDTKNKNVVKFLVSIRNLL